MSVTYRPAKRQGIQLLLGVVGGTGSGKTYSAFLIARGLTGGEPFHVIDTENERALMYADEFDFLHASLKAPFRPSRYTEAIQAAEQAGAKVIVVDSTSHSWAGDGGMLDWHEQLEGGDARKKMTAWIEPKADHRRFVTELLQVRAHVILCFRAEPKVDVVMKNGRMEIVPKATLTGLDGWIPIADKNLPFELTASFLLMADKPGVPRPIKLPEKLRRYVPLEEPLGENTGAALAEWARGATSDAEPSPNAALAAQGAGGPGTEPASSASDQAGASSSPESEAAHPAGDGSTGDAPAPSHEENIAALDAIVTSLSEENIVSKRQVWVAVARMRSKPVDDLIDLYDGKGDDGDVHWSPLRKILRPEEAVELRARLGAKWAKTRETVPA